MDWAWESLSFPICSSLTESSNFTLPLSLNPFFTLLPLPHYLHPLLLCSLTWVPFYNLSYYPFLFSLRGWSAEIEPPSAFLLFFLSYSIQFTRHWFDLNPSTVSYSISYFSRWILQYCIWLQGVSLLTHGMHSTTGYALLIQNRTKKKYM